MKHADFVAELKLKLERNYRIWCREEIGVDPHPELIQNFRGLKTIEGCFAMMEGGCDYTLAGATITALEILPAEDQIKNTFLYLSGSDEEQSEFFDRVMDEVEERTREVLRAALKEPKAGFYQARPVPGFGRTLAWTEYVGPKEDGPTLELPGK